MWVDGSEGEKYCENDFFFFFFLSDIWDFSRVKLYKKK